MSNYIIGLSRKCFGTLLCLIVGGRQIAYFGKKNLQINLIIIMLLCVFVI